MSKICPNHPYHCWDRRLGKEFHRCVSCCWCHRIYEEIIEHHTRDQEGKRIIKTHLGSEPCDICSLPQLKGEWEARFDKLIDELDLWTHEGKTPRENIKAFIHQTLKKDRERLIEKIEGMKQVCNGEFGCGSKDGIHNMAICGSPGFQHIYNQALEDIKEILKQ